MTGPPPPDAGGPRRSSGAGEHAGEHVLVGRALVVLAVAVVVGIVLIGIAGRPPVITGSTVSTSITTTTGAATGATTTSHPATTTSHPTATSHPTTTTRPGRATTTTTSTTTTTTVPHSSVKVLVANGTSVSGAAQHFTEALSGQGWATAPAANASSPVSASAVYYASGQQSAAGTIATELKISPSEVGPLTTSVPVAQTSGVGVVVVIGTDLASQISTTSTT